MGLCILTGRRSSQLSRKVYQLIKKELDKGNDQLFLIVPEQFTLGAETALIEEIGAKGLTGVEVLSPKRLGMRVLKETGGLNRTYMDHHGRNMILQKALVQVQEKLFMYKSSVRKLGFLEKIGELISEMKENEIIPDDLKRVVDELPAGMLKQKMTDLHQIYDEYHLLLGNDRLDEEDRHRSFCDKIPRARFLKNARIWIDGFQNFSSQDYRMIRNLLNQAKELVVALPVELDEKAADASVFELTRKTMERIREIGAREEVSFSIEALQDEAKCRPEICFLEKNLFAYPMAVSEEAVSNVRLFQNQNIWEEVENGARQILRLIREEKCSYRDIVVLTGDMELYGSIIKGIFTQYQIPFFLDELRPIGDNHLIEAVLSALEAILFKYRTDELMGYIKTGFSPITLEESQDFENYCLEFGIRGWKFKNPFTIESQNPSLDLEALNELRQRVMTPLLKLEEKMSGQKNCQEMTQFLYNFLEETNVHGQLDEISRELSERGDFETQSSYEQIFNILMDVFDQLVETMGQEKVDLSEYLRLLKSGIQDYQLGVIPPQGNFINVMDLHRSRNSDFTTLFVFGMNEGKIPGSVSEMNLITDAERRVLDQHQVHFQNNLFFAMEQENFQIYDVLTRPSERLYIFWALSDLEGNSLQPGLLIDRFLKMFKKIEITSTITQNSEQVWDRINQPAVSIWEMIRFQQDKNSGGRSQEVLIWNSVEKWLENNGYENLLEKGKGAQNYTGVLEKMTRDQARKLYGKGLRTSISRLEQFEKCPFSHYVRYGLKPGDRLIYEVAAPEIGTLLHEVVDGFFKMAKEENLELSKLHEDKKNQMIQRLMEENLPKIRKGVFNSTSQYKYLGKKLERVGKRSIDQLLTQIEAGKFMPETTEFSFEYSIEKLKAEFGEIRIHGIIDRLDLYQKEENTWVKIIDYKTGNKSLRYEDIYYGLSLQLVVYLDGALTVLEGENLMPGGTFYFHVNDPIVEMNLEESAKDFGEKLKTALNKEFKLNGLLSDEDSIIAAMDEGRSKSKSDILPVYGNEALLNQEEFKYLMGYVRELVITQIRRIYGGEIQAKPYRKDKMTGCTYCSFQGICQFDKAITAHGYYDMKKSMKKEEFFKEIGKEENDGEEMDG